MSFTTPEFPGRTFDSLDEMKKALEERASLQEQLKEEVVITKVEKIDSPAKG